MIDISEAAVKVLERSCEANRVRRRGARVFRQENGEVVVRLADVPRPGDRVIRTGRLRLSVAPDVDGDSRLLDVQVLDGRRQFVLVSSLPSARDGSVRPIGP